MSILQQIVIYAIAAIIFISDQQVQISATPLHRIRRADGSYSTKYDNFDVSRVLASSRLIKRYGDCLMDRGPCTSEGRFLKDIIPDAIATHCSKCSEIQKKQAGKVLEHILLHNRDLFMELTNKYDPDGNVAKEYGIDSEDKDYNDLDEA